MLQPIEKMCTKNQFLGCIFLDFRESKKNPSGSFPATLIGLGWAGGAQKKLKKAKSGKLHFLESKLFGIFLMMVFGIWGNLLLKIHVSIPGIVLVN